MQWLIAVLVIAVLGLAAIVSSGGLGEMGREPVNDVYRQDLPDRPLTGQDIETLRFGTTLRGYAMGQVDDVLARLGREIAERDALIAELRAGQEPGVELGSESDPEVADLGTDGFRTDGFRTDDQGTGEGESVGAERNEAR